MRPNRLLNWIIKGLDRMKRGRSRCITRTNLSAGSLFNTLTNFDLQTSTSNNKQESIHIRSAEGYANASDSGYPLRVASSIAEKKELRTS